MSGPVETDQLVDVAARAVHAAGDYLTGQFRTGTVTASYGTDDVKAAADREAERRILSVVTEAFPDHAVHGEEVGRQPGEAYEWVVDPLDGTNNFASGLPLFASAVAVRREGETVVSVIYEPLPDSTYVAIRGEGATVNGTPLTAENDVPLEKSTVSFVVGLPAVRDPKLAARATELRRTLEDATKRVVQTWAPCVDWGLLARGSIEGLVAFHPDPYEQHAGALLAAESGVHARETADRYVGAPTGATRDRLLDLLD
jgi:myo-inositol-1(or 4)-monophosphatase